MRQALRERRPIVRRLIVPLIAAIALGCAGLAAPPRGGEQGADVLTAVDIGRSRATDAYEAVRKLRPNFLVARGSTSIAGSEASSLPTIYLDGVPYGPIGALRSIPASDISFIRLFRAADAQMRFGTGNLGGVIDVTTKHE